MRTMRQGSTTPGQRDERDKRDGRALVRAGQRLILVCGAVLALLLSACGQTGPGVAADRLVALGAPDASAQAHGISLLAANQASAQQARERQTLMAAANWYIAHMSLDEQIGQMFLDEMDGQDFTPEMAYMIGQQHVGGIILFPLGVNFGTYNQQVTLDQQIQAHAKIPLFTAADSEGGGLSLGLSEYFGSFPAPGDLGTSGDPRLAYQWGVTTAHDMRQVGINTNFAPVVDVSVNGAESWGSGRTFSSDPRQVALLAGAFMRGQQDAGEISTLKHFPGLGSTVLDPHKTLPVINRSWDQLWSTELYPYRTLVASTPPDLIMSTDELVPVVDPTLPAEVSPAWINGILRQKIGYDGVVITDALWMDGLSQWTRTRGFFDPGPAVVMSVEAGDDLMIAAYNADSSALAIAGLKNAVLSGRISRARIEQSVRRILMVKIKYHLLPMPPTVQAQQPLTALSA